MMWLTSSLGTWPLTMVRCGQSVPSVCQPTTAGICGAHNASLGAQRSHYVPPTTPRAYSLPELRSGVKVLRTRFCIADIPPAGGRPRRTGNNMSTARFSLLSSRTLLCNPGPPEPTGNDYGHARRGYRSDLSQCHRLPEQLRLQRAFHSRPEPAAPLPRRSSTHQSWCREPRKAQCARRQTRSPALASPLA